MDRIGFWRLGRESERRCILKMKCRKDVRLLIELFFISYLMEVPFPPSQLYLSVHVSFSNHVDPYGVSLVSISECRLYSVHMYSDHVLFTGTIKNPFSVLGTLHNCILYFLKKIYD